MSEAVKGIAIKVWAVEESERPGLSFEYEQCVSDEEIERAREFFKRIHHFKAPEDCERCEEAK